MAKKPDDDRPEITLTANLDEDTTIEIFANSVDDVMKEYKKISKEWNEE